MSNEQLSVSEVDENEQLPADGATNNVTEEPGKPNRIDKGTLYLEERALNRTHDGKTYGFSFWTPVFKDDTQEEVEASYNYILEKYGKNVILGVFGSGITNAIRGKANASIGKFEKADEQIREFETKGQKPLISAEDAEKYVPGEREITASSLMMKAVKFMKENDMAVADNMVKFQNMLAQAQELAKKEVEKNAPAVVGQVIP